MGVKCDHPNPETCGSIGSDPSQDILYCPDCGAIKEGEGDWSGIGAINGIAHILTGMMDLIDTIGDLDIDVSDLAKLTACQACINTGIVKLGFVPMRDEKGKWQLGGPPVRHGGD